MVLAGLSQGVAGCYVLKQSYYQLQLLTDRVPVRTVIASEELAAETKKKLVIAMDVLKFAEKSGFPASKNYDTYVPIEGPYVSYLVMAAHPDRLKFVEHWFPFVGSVPYLGFFQKKERDQKAEELAQKGYDIALSGVDAFSTLGWFSDPIYSSMLDRDLFELVNLLFHELTHEFFWVKSSPEFNEQLAEFIAEKMTESFLSEHNMLEQAAEFRKYNSDLKLYKEWIAGLKKALSDLYANELIREDKDILFERKRKLIQNYVDANRPAFQTARFHFIHTRNWNNANVLASSLYLGDDGRLARAFDCQTPRTVANFIAVLRMKLEEGGAPAAVLDAMCSSSQSSKRFEAGTEFTVLDR
jgi:predicted aminopeptidase